MKTYFKMPSDKPTNTLVAIMDEQHGVLRVPLYERRMSRPYLWLTGFSPKHIQTFLHENANSAPCSWWASRTWSGQFIKLMTSIPYFWAVISCGILQIANACIIQAGEISRRTSRSRWRIPTSFFSWNIWVLSWVPLSLRTWNRVQVKESSQCS